MTRKTFRIVPSIFLLWSLISCSTDREMIRSTSAHKEDRLIELLDQGGNAKLRDKSGEPIISLAIRSGSDIRAIESLLSHGASADEANSYGKTPLMWAAETNRVDVMKLLLAKGAHVDARAREGWSALFYAAQADKVEAAEFLLSKGADFKTPDSAGRTCLMNAANVGSERLVNKFLDLGADIKARTASKRN
ncbi:MAG TPA: ankyrin repeat domain-containing protein, partial [Leptospiraceae bacterium]|nr:ankyrin repeat domain-containing protein [Leptospiraceae bacterium]